jgi:hypothetical protein
VWILLERVAEQIVQVDILKPFVKKYVTIIKQTPAINM